MKALHMIAFILTIVGGLNWGLIGVGGPDLVQYTGPAANIIYILVGLSAIWLLVTHKKDCKACSGGSGSSNQAM